MASSLRVLRAQIMAEVIYCLQGGPWSGATIWCLTGEHADTLSMQPKNAYIATLSFSTVESLLDWLAICSTDPPSNCIHIQHSMLFISFILWPFRLLLPHAWLFRPELLLKGLKDSSHTRPKLDGILCSLQISTAVHVWLTWHRVIRFNA